MTTVAKQVPPTTRVIHVFDREGDISEVFDKVNQLSHTGVVVRAAHDRSLKEVRIAYGRSLKPKRYRVITKLS
jgi:hypothetical protein